MSGHPKIVQIGFNKCGTVTLNEFFRANGLSTVHWDDGKFALHAMQRMARREDPFADYPDVTVFTDGSISRPDGLLFESFKHFDYIYGFHPHAYYILNTRDSHDWLMSRANHYDLAERHMRAHGFTTLEEVFGYWMLDWHRHHSAAIEFFAARPTSRFLLFHIEKDTPERLVEFVKDDFPLDPIFYRHLYPTETGRKRLLRPPARMVFPKSGSDLSRRMHPGRRLDGWLRRFSPVGMLSSAHHAFWGGGSRQNMRGMRNSFRGRSMGRRVRGPGVNELEQWFSGKEFTSQGSPDRFLPWQDELAPFRSRNVDVLEVGAGQGRASIFFLRYFANGKLTSVDSFWDKNDERRFDANTREFADRLQTIRKLSLDALNELVWAGRRYDVIYLDGTEERDLVLIDSILAWKLLKVGGLLIWSNYGYGSELPDEWRPRTGIDLFLRMQIGTYKLLLKSYQVVVRRTKDRTKIDTGESSRQA